MMGVWAEAATSLQGMRMQRDLSLKSHMEKCAHGGMR